ncbi:MAG: trigger factor [Chloroflexi bacterium]|nr:trigger factor [Chloroflexota bacterium]
MKVTQDEIVDRQTVLHIEVDADEVEDHLGRAYRRLVGRVAIPGFRKGKAPREIFERQYGRDRLLEEALESLVPDAVNKAIEQNSLEIASSPHVSIEERQPLPKLKATVPLKPIVELSDYKSIRFDDQPEPVTDEQVESVINRAREAQATFEPVDRPLELGDMAVLGAVEAKAGDRTVLTGKDAEYVLHAEATYPAPGFADQLVGSKAGDSKSFTLKLPDNFRDQAAAGKPAGFKVVVSGVKGKNLPALDDEFAKSIGEGAETLEQLREKVRSELEKRAAEEHRNKLEQKALDAIVDATRFEIPPLMVDHETEHLLVDQHEALSRYKLSFRDYMQSVGKTGDQVVNETRDSALRRVKRALALQELVKAEGVTATDEEIDGEIAKLRASARTPQEIAALQSEQTRNNVRSMLLRQKALGQLVEIVKREPEKQPQATPARGE